MNAPIGIGLIGCGDVAHRDYLPEASRLAGRAVIRAVAGRSRERAERTAEAYGIPEVYDDAVSLLTHADVAAVVNLTPLLVHDEINLAVVRSGRHLYSEKTVARDAAGARQLADEAGRAGVVVVCAPCCMIWPQVLVAQQLMTDLGPITGARGVCSGGVPPWPGFASDPAPFFARGAGPLRDLGVYPLHALVGLLGPVTEVAAVSRRSRDGFTVTDGPWAGRLVPIEEDDTWVVTLGHRSGAVSTVEANFTAHDTRAPQLEIAGLDGSVALSLFDHTAPVQQFLGESGTWTEVAVAGGRVDGPDHMAGVLHLVACIRAGTPPVLGLDDAIHVLDIIDAAVVAARDGARRTLASNDAPPPNDPNGEPT